MYNKLAVVDDSAGRSIFVLSNSDFHTQTHSLSVLDSWHLSVEESL